MANIETSQDDYVRYYLKANDARSIRVKQMPSEFREDKLSVVRHEEYHGLFVSYTPTLTFYNEEKNYIYEAYLRNGINVTLYLYKREKKEFEGEVKWVDVYFCLADYSTIKKGKNYITIKFNSNRLEELIKTHESDEFEMERKDSIDGVLLDQVIINKTGLEGRTLFSIGKSVLNDKAPGIINGAQIINLFYNESNTAITKLISQGSLRHSSVDQQDTFALHTDFSTNNYVLPGSLGSNTFFAPDTDDPTETELIVDYDIDFDFKVSQDGANNGRLKVQFIVLDFKEQTGLYSYVERRILFDELNETYIKTRSISGTEKFDLIGSQGVMLIYTYEGLYGQNNIRVYKQDMSVKVTNFFDASINLSFMFVHDVFERLTNIITGKKNIFTSKYFGRKELGYIKDGEGGLIGMISGYWIRAFSPSSDKYKSLKQSIRDLRQSLGAVFNVGFTIESNEYSEKLRCEDAKFFYQNKVGVKFDKTVTDEEEVFDNNLFISSIEIGYEKAGNYTNEAGLDEPNVKAKFVTPIRRSSGKYLQQSKTRADDNGIEEIRRKPEFLFPEESTNSDDDNWFLDLKRDSLLGTFKQKNWQDRLSEIPTGINSPENFKGFFFTPLRMLLRHGWIIRSGLEPFLSKYIKHTTSPANINLTTRFINEDQAYRENSDIQVNKLERSRFLPSKITFIHPLNDYVLKQLYSTTKIFYNGEYEHVSNLFLKMEWNNESRETKRGYILKIDAEKEEFTMLLSNDKIY